MSKFVFFHVGDDLIQPTRLVGSLRQSNPDAEIIMVTDAGTPKLEGVTERIEIEGDRKKIMLMRLTGFSAAQLKEPAMYLDTDMEVLEKIDVEKLLGDRNVLLCRRSFNKDSWFNINLRGMDFSEHRGLTLDQVYPYLACATVTRSWVPWGMMLKLMTQHLNPKYEIWYGDQEALRLYAIIEDTGEIDESEYACLPEFRDKFNPKIVHYKGSRK